jgi:NIMA (never in mitosis gene a)-related kinase
MKILHRDIKTMNVFLVREDSLRIGDLGVAKKLMNTAAFAHTIVGTPYYLSPELCEDKPYNIKSDMWALGCVLYELCTLKHPFDANNQGALFMKIIRASYAPVSSQYSAELRQLLDACLHKDYKKRPSAATILSRPGMKERTIGLNIAIPEGSAMGGTVVQLPPSPPSDTPHHSKHSSRASLAVEEEKPPKKPADKKLSQVPKVSVGPKAHQELADLQGKKRVQSPVMKAVPKAVVDLAPGKVKVESRQPVSNPPKSAPIPSKQKVHEQAPQRIRKGAPNAMARNAQQKVIKPPTATPQIKQPIPRVNPTQPSIPVHSGAEPKRTSYLGNQEELDEIKQVLNLPEYTGKKKLSVSDIREEPRPSPQPISRTSPIEEIKTEPWKPQDNMSFPEYSNPMLYDPLDVEEAEDTVSDGEAEHLSEEAEEQDQSGSHSPDETVNGREVRGMQVDSRTRCS